MTSRAAKRISWLLHESTFSFPILSTGSNHNTIFTINSLVCHVAHDIPGGLQFSSDGGGLQSPLAWHVVVSKAWDPLSH